MNEYEFQLLIQKYRDEPASSLQFQPCIDLLIDSKFCKDINEIIHKPGMKWERCNAVHSLGLSLPDERGLYMFVWRPELAFQFASPPSEERPSWALYIGKAGIEGGNSDTIKNRYVGEYSKYLSKDASCLWEKTEAVKRHERLARFLTLRPLEYWFLTMQDINDISLLERKLIRLLNPPLNRQHGIRVTPGKTVPAF